MLRANSGDAAEFDGWVNLAQPRLGAEVIYASDEFFAPKDRLLDPRPPVFVADRYDDNGKWMDGWETRRRRAEGHEFCLVRMGIPCAVKGLDIDTTHFTGNYPPAASVDACYSLQPPDERTDWFALTPSVALSGDSHHRLVVNDDRTCTHLRLNIYPDGGLARFRVYGEARSDWYERDSTELIDLVALHNGGRAITCNDEHFGSPSNLIMPGPATHMGDGWETRRRREPGNDWAIFALGHPGIVAQVEVDTSRFKGNYPERCSLQATYACGGTKESLIAQSMFWKTLLPEQFLQMSRLHHFDSHLRNLGPITHVRFNIFPDGGVSRLRLLGHIEGDPCQ